MFRSITGQTEGSITVTFNGQLISVPKNFSVAATLLTVTDTVRSTPVSGAPRGPYCMMGVCFDCLVTIDGRPNQQGCMILVRDGMQIETQDDKVRLKKSLIKFNP